MDSSRMGVEMEETFDHGMFQIYGSDLPFSYYELLKCSFTAQPPLIAVNSSSSSSSAPASASRLITFIDTNVELSDHLEESDDCIPHDDLINPDSEANSSLLSPTTILDFSNGSVGCRKINDAGKEKNPERVRSASVIRNTRQAREHLMSERKRRQKMAQLFISLSKVLPGIKKLDKASLLEDAVNYTRALQESIRVLEEERRQMSVESSKASTTSGIDPPAIKVRVSDKSVLIRIWCKNQKGLLPRIHMEMERVNLSVVDLRVMPFGANIFADITILAQMQSELGRTVKEIVDQLEKAFSNPLGMHAT